MKKQLREYKVGEPIDDVFLFHDIRFPSKGNWSAIAGTLSDETGSMPVIQSFPNQDQRAFAHTWGTARVKGIVKDDSKYQQREGAMSVDAKEGIFYEKPATMEGLEKTTLLDYDRYIAMLNDLMEPYDSQADEEAWLLMSVARSLVNGRFLTIPAAEKMHHAVTGGLLQHTVEVATFAEWISVACNKLGYPVSVPLVVAGAIVHDIGKVGEYDGDGFSVTYGRDGMIGHIPLGIIAVEDAIRATPGNWSTLRADLLGIVSSHHGTLEHGSPVTPRTRAAIIVHVADSLSATLDIHRRTKEQAKDTGAVFEKGANGQRYMVADTYGEIEPYFTMAQNPSTKTFNLPPETVSVLADIPYHTEPSRPVYATRDPDNSEAFRSETRRGVPEKAQSSESDTNDGEHDPFGDY